MVKGKKKIGKLTIGDAFGVALAKTFGEKLLSPLVGNGTLISGALKIGIAMFTKQIVDGKIGDILGTALVVDGTEDIVTPLITGGLGGLGLGGGNGAEVI